MQHSGLASAAGRDAISQRMGGQRAREHLVVGFQIEHDSQASAARQAHCAQEMSGSQDKQIKSQHMMPPQCLTPALTFRQLGGRRLCGLSANVEDDGNSQCSNCHSFWAPTFHSLAWPGCAQGKVVHASAAGLAAMLVHQPFLLTMACYSVYTRLCSTAQLSLEELLHLMPKWLLLCSSTPAWWPFCWMP